MAGKDRRNFLKLMGSGAFAATMQQSISRALAIPAHNRTGTIDDVEHIVVLMQENRSFDHYFGSLSGVRGFSDPRAMRLPGGQTVWNQPNAGGTVLPFHPDAPSLGLQFIEDLPHDWTTTHAAWNGGRWDQWVPQKGTTTMAYLTREDIPFHYALADAFTICDAYHCSIMSSTDPNRYYMWTGWVGNDGQGGGPVVDNAEAGYDWHTYPERLQAAGIGWKIYQDVGAGLTAAESWGWGSDAYIGNYGDNSLLYFHQYQNAADGSPLAVRARTGTDISESGTLFDQFRADVQNGTLPSVSWIAAPEAYTEHPNWPANYGAWYVSQILDILTSNPEVWSKTVFLLTYDENDGFFDHMVPPTPPADASAGASTVATTNEFFPGSTEYAAGPYGLGVRVPMLVISPWSKGGFVNSQLFDHTSIIRFIEARFARNRPALVEPNITPWRRAVCGDLTSAFDFRTPNGGRVALPATASYAPPDRVRHADYVPTVPTQQSLPKQESGLRRARALPYRPEVEAVPDHGAGVLRVSFRNRGDATIVYQARPANGQPRCYTVEPGRSLSDSWAADTQGGYELEIHGPNGFFRLIKGRLSGAGASALVVGLEEDAVDCGLVLTVVNAGQTSVRPTLEDGYLGGNADREAFAPALAPGASRRIFLPLAELFGWYDLSVGTREDPGFLCRVAGHVETGRDSITDPALGL